MARPLPDSIDETQKLLASGDYVADRSLATSLFLALAMRRPLFLEGEAGVGKTEIGKVIAQGLGRELIRLQCYEGLDIAQAAYEWNYSRQMIEIRLAEAAGEKSKEKLAADIYSEKFLIKRPLARALEGDSPVLLIDELDRTDEPFEAYLLEVLSDWQITIPEVGTLRASEPPIVVITSNRTREIHDAVKRRAWSARRGPRPLPEHRMRAMSFFRRLLGGKHDGVEQPTQNLLSLCDALLSERGEYASASLAREALVAYQGLDERQRDAFYDALARQYSPSAEAVSRAAAAYQAEPTPENLLRLQNSVEPARQELFRRLNMAPGGTAALVEMRRRLLTRLETHPHWRAIDLDLMHLLRSWFNRGFLRLERIDWRTSALVLEKLIQYEALHALHGWRDLRRRLESDRRCFAFFHPQLPDEPIIFIEVALARGMSAHVQPLLDVGSPVGTLANVDCAMFYSITNCQEGLRGISFGNLLIKQVAEDLKREFPHLRRFATLSPIPGFRRWLDENRMRVAVGAEGKERLALLSRLEDPAWQFGEVPEALQSLLMRLCAYYLLNAKQGLEPLDAVARFHLGNGAALERLNWMGDCSEQGMSRSAGLMVNYVYWLAEVERNHERYFREHHIVASPLVEKLARECPLGAQAEKGAAA